MDAQFIAAALEASTHAETSKRLETYAIGLAISEAIGHPLCEFNWRGKWSNESERSFRFGPRQPVHQWSRHRYVGSRVEDYFWVLIEPERGHTATVWVNYGGAANDLATDYARGRCAERVAWLDITREITRMIGDLIAVEEEVAA